MKAFSFFFKVIAMFSAPKLLKSCSFDTFLHWIISLKIYDIIHKTQASSKTPKNITNLILFMIKHIISLCSPQNLQKKATITTQIFWFIRYNLHLTVLSECLIHQQKNHSNNRLNIEENYIIYGRWYNVYKVTKRCGCC